MGKVVAVNEGTLEGILAELIKVQKYLKDPTTVIGRYDSGTPYGISYVNKEGKGSSPMNKEVGSPLCYLDNTIRSISRQIAEMNKPHFATVWLSGSELKYILFPTRAEAVKVFRKLHSTNAFAANMFVYDLDKQDIWMAHEGMASYELESFINEFKLKLADEKKTV